MQWKVVPKYQRERFRIKLNHFPSDITTRYAQRLKAAQVVLGRLSATTNLIGVGMDVTIASLGVIGGALGAAEGCLDGDVGGVLGYTCIVVQEGRSVWEQGSRFVSQLRVLKAGTNNELGPDLERVIDHAYAIAVGSVRIQDQIGQMQQRGGRILTQYAQILARTTGTH